MKSLVEQFQNVRRVSTPLVQIKTSDASNVAQRITEANTDVPVLQWDASAGFNARNKSGGAAVAAVAGKEPQVLNAADAVFMLRKVPGDSIVFILNAHKVWQDISTLQGIWNLRDQFKATNRVLVLLTTMEAATPRELEGDVIVLNDSLPDEDLIQRIIRTQCENAVPNPIPVPKGDDMRKAIDAMKGLPPFIVEQSVALALRSKGVSIAELWNHKREAVKQTPGATIHEGSESFATLGGQDGLKRNLLREIGAKRPVKVIVIFDEFEKMMAGAASEHVGDGGVAKDANQVVLTRMQDHNMRGVILFGHPGCGKTEVAKAMGREADCLVIKADMGAMKGGVVGESEARVRAFFNMVQEIAGDGGVFIVATCNSTGVLTSEVRRRFKSGFYFVDLPDRAEKDAIWSIQMQRYSLKSQALPVDDQWTGSEIANCCEKADNYGISLIEAAEMIVPLAKSQPQLIEQRRREAHNSMLSAATGSTYTMPDDEHDEPSKATKETARARRVTVES